jgi:hypothetical protein
VTDKIKVTCEDGDAVKAVVDALEKASGQKLGKPHKVDRWYDRHSRNWIIQLKDEKDWEIECQYTGDKQSALLIENEYKKEYNL